MTQTLTLADQLNSLLQAVDTQLAPDAGHFVGRAFLVDEINEFFAVDNRIFVLVGQPGLGKTAFAAELLRSHLADARPYLAHFCALPGQDNPYQFCRSLLAQLKALFGEAYLLTETARQQEITINNQVTIGSAARDAQIVALQLNIGGVHPREAFRQLIREPLNRYASEHPADRQKLVIVIDALDKAWEWDGGQDQNLLNLLIDAQDLPEWVNLICMARPGPAVQSLRLQAGVRVLDVDNERRDLNRADLKTFVESWFLATMLQPQQTARLQALLQELGLLAAEPAAPFEPFVQRVVAASEGNFLFLRRYLAALVERLALPPQQSDAELRQLLQLDAQHHSLASLLQASYQRIWDELQLQLNQQPPEDRRLVEALALAFAPLDLPLLRLFTGLPENQILPAVARLQSLVVDSLAGQLTAYAWFHRSFGDFVREQLALRDPWLRQRDVELAALLEQANVDQPGVASYSTRFRWAHLLRGLDLAATPVAVQLASGTTPPAADTARQFDSIAAVQQAVRDVGQQASLLRGLARRALDPTQTGPQASWELALRSLRTAEQALWNSPRLNRLRQHWWHGEQLRSVPTEVVELESTLIALGDAYVSIALRMDPRRQLSYDLHRRLFRLQALFDLLLRLPLALFLLGVLLFQRVGELHIPGALENLGRDQDWTIARLYVLAISAYRRARRIANLRNSPESADALVERLARTYSLMGAYEAAVNAFESLLSLSVGASSPWRQAVLRLALGEVLLNQQQTGRAVDLLNSAHATFVAMQAPVQQGRALSALAHAYHLQADTAEQRADDVQAQRLDDRTIACAREAIAAWNDVTQLTGDDTLNTDRQLALSYLAHLLWHVGRLPRSNDARQRTVRELLDGIAERHFPQRFEHPLLRIFRLSILFLAPLILLFGLLFAIVPPHDLRVYTYNAIDFLPPLLDLNRHPSELIDAEQLVIDTADSRIGIGEITQISALNLAYEDVDLEAKQPGFERLSIFRLLLLFLLIYLGIYTLAGLLIVALSSPAQYQTRRPGRLVLTEQRIAWLGPPGQGALLDLWDWLLDDLRFGLQRLWWRGARFVGVDSPTPARPAAEIRPELALADIERMTVVRRNLLSEQLNDYSFTVLHAAKGAPFSVRGSLVNYSELSNELEERLQVPRVLYRVNLLYSFWGLLFVTLLVYALLLVAFLPIFPEWLTRPLPLIEYSISALYVLVMPGLLLPLLWWFVFQPLRASRIYGRLLFWLVLIAEIGFVLMFIELGGVTSFEWIGIEPDLLLPTLVIGLLGAVVYHAPPRPLRQFFRLEVLNVLRVFLILFSLACLLIMGQRVTQRLAWYDALVRGNQAMNRALADSEQCLYDASACTRLEQNLAQSVQHYSQAICVNPTDRDVYMLRGYALIKAQRFPDALRDFEYALNPETPGAAPAIAADPAACVQPTVWSALRAQQRASLHASIAAVWALQAARSGAPGEDARVIFERADSYYGTALRNYAQALQVLGSAPALQQLEQPRAGLTCQDLVARALKPAVQSSLPLVLDLSELEHAQIDQLRAPVLLQLADTCYSRSFFMLRLSADPAAPPGLVDLAWNDVSAAALAYQAVLSNAADPAAADADLFAARYGLAASWLALSQFEQRPLAAPDAATNLLRAQELYAGLVNDGVYDLLPTAGQAWSSLRLGALEQARAPLQRVIEQAEQASYDPLYESMLGLVYWLDSARYDPPAPRSGSADPGYERGLRQALEHYSRAILIAENSASDIELRIQALATRSVLCFSLRNLPRETGQPYRDQDYGFWLQRAIADIDAALLLAQSAQPPIPDQDLLGYRYWRGRLNLSLALTWQQKGRGLHAWSEIVPLYARAYADLSAAVRDDPIPTRKALYEQRLLPWTRLLLDNAVHLQQTHEAIQQGDYQRARRELELVDPLPERVEQWDRLSAPRPEYSFLHGLISLALDSPDDFRNPLVEPLDSTQLDRATLSYTQAIAETEDATLVPQRSAAYPTDARNALYQQALSDLDALIHARRESWSASQRQRAEAIRLLLELRLNELRRAELSSGQP